MRETPCLFPLFTLQDRPLDGEISGWIGDSPLGETVVLLHKEAIFRVALTEKFGREKFLKEALVSHKCLLAQNPLILARKYFPRTNENPLRAFLIFFQEMPIFLYGTPFQQRVWRALCQIPFGETRCYEDIARDVGNFRAVRPVASAIAANPIAVIVPCHRVLPKSGGIGEFHWGAEVKKRLLAYERWEAAEKLPSSRLTTERTLIGRF